MQRLSHRLECVSLGNILHTAVIIAKVMPKKRLNTLEPVPVVGSISEHSSVELPLSEQTSWHHSAVHLVVLWKTCWLAAGW